MGPMGFKTIRIRTARSNNSNISILITINRGNVIVKKKIVKKQAAYINKNSDDTYG